LIHPHATARRRTSRQREQHQTMLLHTLKPVGCLTAAISPDREERRTRNEQVKGVKQAKTQVICPWLELLLKDKTDFV